MNITDIDLFKRLKKSPLQKEINLLNSNLFLSGTPQKIKDLTNGTAESFVAPSDGFYFVSAINTSASGACAAFILDSSQTVYICATNAPSGTYVRAATSPIPLRAGARVVVRAAFTDKGALYKLV